MRPTQLGDGLIENDNKIERLQNPNSKPLDPLTQMIILQLRSEVSVKYLSKKYTHKS